MTCWKAWVHIRLKIKERHQKGRVFPLPFWSWSDRKWFELRVVDELCFPSEAFRPSCLTKGLLTVWPDYFLTFGHLCQWKLSPWHTKFVKASPKFSQIGNKHSKIARLWKICQIWSNCHLKKAFKLFSSLCCIYQRFLIGQSRPFLSIFILFTLQFKYKLQNCCSWDSYPGPQDGRRRPIH